MRVRCVCGRLDQRSDAPCLGWGHSDDVPVLEKIAALRPQRSDRDRDVAIVFHSLADMDFKLSHDSSALCDELRYLTGTVPPGQAS